MSPILADGGDLARSQVGDKVVMTTPDLESRANRVLLPLWNQALFTEKNCRKIIWASTQVPWSRFGD